ncbi:MAG: CIA30 family protein [Anaerolineales bacterium]|nr:CIA30 family protein [Anaerolineales bacterium]
MFNKRLTFILGALVLGVLLVFAFTTAATFPAAAQSVFPTTPNVTSPVVDDFEAGIPDTNAAAAPPYGWIEFGEETTNPWDGNSVLHSTWVSDTAPYLANNHSILITYTIGNYGGISRIFQTSQDWSAYDGLSFWVNGQNTGNPINIQLFENRGDPNADSSERFLLISAFTDDFTGWQRIMLPFSSFVRNPYYQPPTAPDDGFTLEEVWGYAIDIPAGLTGAFNFDQVQVYGSTVAEDVKVGFEMAGYAIPEGGTALLTVILNTPASVPVSVTYTTVDGSAKAGADYTATTGTLVFPAATLAQTFTVDTIGDDTYTGDRSLTVQLSNPVNAMLGARDEATLKIEEDEALNMCEVREDLIDDFEDGLLPYGQDGNDIPIGFFTWSDGSSSVAITTTYQIDNWVLQLDSQVVSYGGLTHHFENETLDTWLIGDWSTYQGVSFWVYGRNTGATLFFEVQDNRNPGSTNDDTEIWSYPFTDNFSGWQKFEVPFEDFNRKEIGNGAPNDGFTLTEVHGWAFGSLAVDETYFLDDIAICGVTDSRQDLSVGFSLRDFSANEGQLAEITVKLNMPATVPVTVSYASENSQAVNAATLWRDYQPAAGQLIFAPGVTEQTFALELLDDLKYEGEEGLRLLLSDPISASLGALSRARLLIQDDESPDAFLIEDFEDGLYRLWDFETQLSAIEVQRDLVVDGFQDGLPDTNNQVSPPPYGWIPFGFESGSSIASNIVAEPADFQLGSNQAVSITYNIVGWGGISRIFQGYSQDWSAFDGISFWVYGTDSGNAVNIQLFENRGDPNVDSSERWIIPAAFTDDFLGWQQINLPFASFVRNGWQPGGAPDDGLTLEEVWGYGIDIPGGQSGTFYFDQLALYSADFEPRPYQDRFEHILRVTEAPAILNGYSRGFGDSFAQQRDWSSHTGLTFWYYGQNSGETITFELLDNRAPDPGPAGWSLVWSDEFDGGAGVSPNADIWTHEIGSGFDQGITGWGNGEYQYYTNSPINSATDGSGNLVITATQINTATTDLVCWYGACEYTSARLITDQKFDLAYGRVEARIKVPYGNGLWPAFWMLGSDIGEVGWPQSGEIDIMEHIGREPQMVYGTIHGPGYSGGNGVGGSYNLGADVADEFHVFAIEWEPDVIRWYIDDTNYFTATPGTIPAGTEWVYDHPFYLLLNVAVGGNWPGDPDETTVFPQTMHVDYVRVYQADDTAERFTASFVDDFEGWQLVEIPFSALVRSDGQPVGAPDDGLTLSEVWGYSFFLPEQIDVPMLFDLLRLKEYRYFSPLLYR